MVVLTKLEYLVVLVSLFGIGFSIGKLYTELKEFVKKETLKEMRMKEE